MTLRRAMRRGIVQISAVMTAVLLLTGGVALLLVTRNQSRALGAQLSAVLAAADDVGDPPQGSYLARPRPDGTVELTPGTPGPVGQLLTDVVAAGGSDARGEPESVDLPGSGTYRVETAYQAGGELWAIASDLAALRSEQQDVVRALLLAESAGVAGAVAAAVLLSRRSVEPLAQALALQRRFVADASHELRAPLTVLHTRAQILAADPASRSGSALGEGLRGLVEDTRALGEVIEDLLASAELDRHPRRMQRTDLNEIADAVVRSTSAHGLARGVTLAHLTDQPHQPLPVMGHPTALRRAVTALVDNAIRHTPAGGAVQISTAGAGDRVELVVTDDGTGFDSRSAKGLFVRSFHGAPAGEDPGGARFGLGLALVREIADAHGGSITAAGSPGEGARFTLDLPHAPQPHQRPVDGPGGGTDTPRP